MVIFYSTDIDWMWMHLASAVLAAEITKLDTSIEHLLPWLVPFLSVRIRHGVFRAECESYSQQDK